MLLWEGSWDVVWERMRVEALVDCLDPQQVEGLVELMAESLERGLVAASVADSVEL